MTTATATETPAQAAARRAYENYETRERIAKQKEQADAQRAAGTLLNHPTLGRCKVIAVHPLGTIDVQNIFTDRCYRITGLPMTAEGGSK